MRLVRFPRRLGGVRYLWLSRVRGRGIRSTRRFRAISPQRLSWHATGGVITGRSASGASPSAAYLATCSLDKISKRCNNCSERARTTRSKRVVRQCDHPQYAKYAKYATAFVQNAYAPTSATKSCRVTEKFGRARSS
eukprot:354122-Prymnesium_polylepis.1